MIRQVGLDAGAPDPRSVVTVGTFDGVHRGHQAVLGYLLRRAEAQDGQSVVLTFDPHPREVVREEPVPLLTTIDERAELVASRGVDRFIVVPFTREFSRLSAEEFVRDVLVRRVGLREIVVGYDHGFGRGREGDRALLEELGRVYGFAVDVMPAQIVEEHVVSSTEVRHLLEEGDVAGAARLLGRPYRLGGEVVRGDARGRRIGFPTANVSVDHPRKVVPRHGVYAVRADVPGRGAVPGMMNIGRRPTVGGTETRLEVHLLGFDADLYGARIQVQFIERLRDERRFESLEALSEQLSKDRARCMEALETLF